MSKIDFRKMRTYLFFGLIFVLGAAVLKIFQPFFYPIFWAAIIAVVFYPWYSSIHHHLKSTHVSALLTIIFVLLLIFLPLALVALLIYEQSVQLYLAIAGGQFNFNIANLATLLSHTPFGPYVDTTSLGQNASDIVSNVSLFIFNNLRSFTQDVAIFIFQFFVMVYTLFYFFKDGPHMLQRLMHLSPLGDNYELMLYERFTSTARATIKGSFIIGGIQGVVGGVLFLIAGVQGAFISGVQLRVRSGRNDGYCQVGY
jgi:predicted PurR-regulated permease PerM